MQYKYFYTKRTAAKIRSFYRNVSKKYRHTYSYEDMERNVRGMSQGQDTDITMADGRWMDGGWLRAFREVRFLREKLAGKVGERYGETGRDCRGNGEKGREKQDLTLQCQTIDAPVSTIEHWSVNYWTRQGDSFK